MERNPKISVMERDKVARLFFEEFIKEGTAIANTPCPIYERVVEIGRIIETDGRKRLEVQGHLNYYLHDNINGNPFQDIRKIAEEKGLTLELGEHIKEIGRNYYIIINS